MKKGKLVVIDGADGSGKATQAKLLLKKLRAQKIPSEAIDFPQYNTNFFGKLIGECLAGKHGDFIAISPYIVSALYAADRHESKKKIEKWLREGKTVIADRYVSANQIHQAGKIGSDRERKVFLKWLDTMEHETFGLPRPDLIIYLDVPLSISYRLLADKSALARKNYLKGKKDLAENNQKYLEDARSAALKIIGKNVAWKRIVCHEDGAILAVDTIHELILKEVLPIAKMKK